MGGKEFQVGLAAAHLRLSSHQFPSFNTQSTSSENKHACFAGRDGTWVVRNEPYISHPPLSQGYSDWLYENLLRLCH